jgi:hypothetical protein
MRKLRQIRTIARRRTWLRRLVLWIRCLFTDRRGLGLVRLCHYDVIWRPLFPFPAGPLVLGGRLES